MLQPKKPWEQEYQSEETTTKKPWEMDMQSDDLKKKESSESISTTQNGNGASVQKDGFSDSQKASLDNFKVNSTDLQNAPIGNKSKTLDIPKEADLTMRKVQLEKQIATKPQDRKDFKQNPKYASAKEELHDVNSKLQQVKEVENQKNAQLDSSIENAIFTVDDNKIKSAIDSEVNDNEISDYAREGGKNVLNVLGGIANIAPKTINALSGGKLDLPTYEPFEKKIPFEKATKQVNDEIKEAKKKDPNLEITPEQFNQRVKDVFVEQQKQNQYQENASKLLADADPQVQERIKAKYINEIGGLDKSAKANSVLIQALDNKATPLRKELLETKQLIDAGKADPTTIADFNSKLENYNQMEQQYAKLVSEQEKNSNKKLTAEDRLKLFKLDYNPYSKAIDDLTAPTAKMLGEGVYALGKASDAISELPIIGDDRKAKGEKSALTEAGDSLIKSAEEVTARHQNNKFSDIDGFGKFGSWATQTVGTVAPYVLGSAIGTTEEQALSKAFLTPSKALAGFSTASAGGAMNEMDTEMKDNPNIHYNNWQYAGKVLGSVGSNAIMFGNYGSMLKGNKALFESITKTPEANVEFQKGIKDYLDTALKTGKGMNKSGAVMMGSQAINMFVDNHILGKKHEDGFDELANAYIEGSAMHGLISEVPNLASFMIEKVLPNGAKKEINQNLKKGYGLVKELQNPDLTPDEKSVIQTQIDAIHKDNERLLKASNKVVEGFTHNQVKELLKIDQDKFEITKDVEDIKKGNYSKEYKENALAEKKAEFYALESRRQAVFENEHNALTLLPKSEQNRLEREAKNRIAEKEGKDVSDIKFEPKEVNDTALRIHKTELKEQAVKDAEAKIPTPETKSKAEVPQQAEAEKVAEFPLKEGETLVETKQDNKGRTFNTVAITTEKEGLKKTKFLFNRSDKPSDQRNLSSISPEKLSSDFGFEISKDDVPEGFEVTRVKEIRETDKGSAATVTIKDTESDESWDAEIVITKTKETPKPQEVSPVEDVVATSVENIKNNGLKISGVTSIEFEDNNETILYGTKNNKTRISIKGMSKEQIQEEYDFDKQVFEKNKNRDFEAEEVEIKKSKGMTDNEKISALKELKSSKRYNDVLENITLPFYETKLNEATPETNTPTNGNVQLGVGNMAEVGDAEYNDFIDKGKVSNERLNDIANKVKNREPLSDREKAIFSDKTGEINKIIATKAGSGGVGGDVVYHGSPIIGEKGDLTPSGSGELGAGVYFTRNEGLAKNYSKPRGEVKNMAEAESKSGVANLDLSGLKIKTVTKDEYLNKRSEFYDKEQELNNGEWDLDVAKRAEEKLIKQYEKEGYDGLEVVDEQQGVIFPDSVKKAKHLNKKAVEQSLKETPQAETNEATPTNIAPTDGEIRPTVEPSRESTASEQQVIEPKSVPEAVDNSGGKSDAKVDKKTYESADTRGKHFAIIKDGKIMTSGSNPSLAENPMPIKQLLELAKNYNGKLYLSDKPIASVDYKTGDIMGYTFDQINSRQQGKGFDSNPTIKINDGVDKVEIKQYEDYLKEQPTKSIEGDVEFTSKGENRAVNENGEPITVYHGTGEDFKDLDGAKQNSATGHGDFGKGFYFSADEGIAKYYSLKFKNRVVKSFNIKIKNPFEINITNEIFEKDTKDELLKLKYIQDYERDIIKDATNGDVDFGYKKITKEIGDERFSNILKENGYDGVFVNRTLGGETTKKAEIVVFDKNNIKPLFPQSEAVDGGESKTDVPKKEIGAEKVNKPFEGEQGKSSILKRISEGGNSAEVNKTVEDIGLNYAVRKQDQVYADAVNFVNKVGIVEAYNAIKNNLIQFGDSVSVIYAEIVDRLPAEIEKELSKVTDVSEREKLQKEYNDLQEKIYSEFSARAIDLGQANSILNYIYNKNTAVKYSLANQIKEFKNINSGEIDAETLDKFKKLDKEYKEAIAKIADLEKIVQEANEQKDFENIVEEETRPKANKPSKKKTAENAIKALDKFEKSLLKNTYSDATLITPILIQGVRLTKASIKAGMAVSEAVEKGIEQIKKEIEKLGKTFDSEDKFRKDLQDALGEAVVKEDKVTVDKNGNLKIPMNIIKDYISKGGNDLAELSEQIHETIKEEYPNIDVKDIRQKIAGIGKTSNKTKTQLETDITNLKRVERLKLELEDLQEGIAKTKNPVRKQKLSSIEKKLKSQIKDLQDALGITEEQRTQNSINYTKRRISELKEKIENKDYSKKEIKPIEENAELKKLKIEKNRIQEEFDTAKYKKELENRGAVERIKDFVGDMWDSQRVTRATGELSFVGAQGGFYMVDSTFSRKTFKKLVENFKGTTVEDWKKSPIKTMAKIVKSAHSAESIIEMFNKMGTKNNYDDFQKALKEHPDYDLFLKSGLRVLGEDFKTQVKDEMFIGNHLLNILKLPFIGITKLDKGTKRTTLQGYYEKLKTGQVSEKNKKNVSEMFDATNPLSVFERGNNTFMNMARVEMFEQGVQALRQQGKNPIDHIQEYKDLASAVNTVTGSANLGQAMTMAVPILNKLIFSPRFWASSLNMTPPVSLYYLAKLGNYDNITANPKSWKNFKPSVAQKAFVKPMIKGLVAFYGLSALTVALINSAIDDDDELTEAEKKQKRAYIEYDPRSSNFMQVVSGNTRTDFFGPMRGNVVLLSKLLSRQTKKQNGEIVDNGSEFGSKTNFDIFANYASNKANPFVGMFVQNMKGHREDVTNEKTGKVEQRVVNGFDTEDLDIRNQTINNMLPIFYDTTKDILEEDPPLGSAFYITMSALGKQTSVYNGQIDKFVKEQNDRAKEPTFEETFEKARKSDMSKYTTNINLLEDLVMAKNLGLTQYISEKGEKIPLKNMNWDLVSEAIEKQKELKEKTKNFPMPKQKVKSPD